MERLWSLIARINSRAVFLFTALALACLLWWASRQEPFQAEDYTIPPVPDIAVDVAAARRATASASEMGMSNPFLSVYLLSFWEMEEEKARILDELEEQKRRREEELRLKEEELLALQARLLAEAEEREARMLAEAEEREAAVAAREAALSAREAALLAGDAVLASREAALVERDAHLAALATQLQGQAKQLEEQAARLQELETRLAERERQLAEKEKQLAELEARLAAAQKPAPVPASAPAPVPAPAPVRAGPRPMALVYRGYMRGPDGAMVAMIENRTAKRQEGYRLGDAIIGYSVTNISPKHVEIVLDGVTNYVLNVMEPKAIFPGAKKK